MLGTLDDKIELNRRMNETLEAMARALFKSWFVDFDPVRAKAEGRDPGLPKHIADLFPDRFEDSELGEIPAGWGIKKVSHCIEVAYGKAPKDINPEEQGPSRVLGSKRRSEWHDEKQVAETGITCRSQLKPGRFAHGLRPSPLRLTPRSSGTERSAARRYFRLFRYRAQIAEPWRQTRRCSTRSQPQHAAHYAVATPD